MEITENDKSKIYELHKNGMKISDLAIMFVGELSTESMLEVLTAIREIKKKKRLNLQNSLEEITEYQEDLTE